MSRTIMRTIPLAALGALAALGCQAGDVTSPAGPEFVLSGSNARTHVEVCKYGSGASFSWTVNGTAQTGFALTDGECQTIYTNSAAGTAATPIDVAVTEVSADAGYALDHIVLTQYQYVRNTDLNPTVTVTNPAGPSATGQVGLETGASIAFYNVRVPTTGGCTYTQGGYKNTLSRWPAGYDPNAAFYGSGKTWLEMFNTPPKGGDVYVKLAHQYMAAKMNIVNGATATCIGAGRHRRCGIVFQWLDQPVEEPVARLARPARQFQQRQPGSGALRRLNLRFRT